MDTNVLSEVFSQALGMDCKIVKGGSDTPPYKIEFQSKLSVDEFIKFADVCKRFLSQYGIETGAIVAVNPEANNKIFTLQINKLPSAEEIPEKFAALTKVVQLDEMARKGDLKALKKLLAEKNTDINISNINGETLLFPAAISAIFTGNFSIMELLLEKEMDINHQDNGGATMLHITIAQYSEATRDFINIFRVVEMLLDKGADLTIKTFKGETPLQVADRVNDIEVGKLLIDTLLKKASNTEKTTFKTQQLSDYWDEKISQLKELDDKPTVSAMTPDETSEEAGSMSEAQISPSQIVRGNINFFPPATRMQAANSPATAGQAEVESTAASLGK